MATIRIVSFGYGHAAAPDAHITLDLRTHFRDPHINPALRHMTAHDKPVRRAVFGTPGIRPLLAATVRAVQAYATGPGDGPITIATGCAGGRHRAATVANNLARRLRRRGHTVTVHHRDLNKPVIAR
jgi:UPF0042 nucleotide-binding protein